MLEFSSLAVQAVENELFVQLVVGVADKPPNSFSLCFKVLPGAQSGLQMVEKQNNNIHGYAHTEVKRGSNRGSKAVQKVSLAKYGFVP